MSKLVKCLWFSVFLSAIIGSIPLFSFYQMWPTEYQLTSTEGDFKHYFVLPRYLASFFLPMWIYSLTVTILGRGVIDILEETTELLLVIGLTLFLIKHAWIAHKKAT